MIQNKTIHYWKLGRDELLLARRNPEIQEIKDQKETKKTNNNKYILFLLY